MPSDYLRHRRMRRHASMWVSTRRCKKHKPCDRLHRAGPIRGSHMRVDVQRQRPVTHVGAEAEVRYVLSNLQAGAPQRISPPGSTGFGAAQMQTLGLLRLCYPSSIDCDVAIAASRALCHQQSPWHAFRGLPSRPRPQPRVDLPASLCHRHHGLVARPPRLLSAECGAGGRVRGAAAARLSSCLQLGVGRQHRGLPPPGAPHHRRLLQLSGGRASKPLCSGLAGPAFRVT